MNIGSSVITMFKAKRKALRRLLDISFGFIVALAIWMNSSASEAQLPCGDTPSAACVARLAISVPVPRPDARASNQLLQLIAILAAAGEENATTKAISKLPAGLREDGQHLASAIRAGVSGEIDLAVSIAGRSQNRVVAFQVANSLERQGSHRAAMKLVASLPKGSEPFFRIDQMFSLARHGKVERGLSIYRNLMHSTPSIRASDNAEFFLGFARLFPVDSRKLAYSAILAPWPVKPDTYRELVRGLVSDLMDLGAREEVLLILDRYRGEGVEKNLAEWRETTGLIANIAFHYARLGKRDALRALYQRTGNLGEALDPTNWAYLFALAGDDAGVREALKMISTPTEKLEAMAGAAARLHLAGKKDAAVLLAAMFRRLAERLPKASNAVLSGLAMLAAARGETISTSGASAEVAFNITKQSAGILALRDDDPGLIALLRASTVGQMEPGMYEEAFGTAVCSLVKRLDLRNQTDRARELAFAHINAYAARVKAKEQTAYAEYDVAQCMIAGADRAGAVKAILMFPWDNSSRFNLLAALAADLR